MLNTNSSGVDPGTGRPYTSSQFGTSQPQNTNAYSLAGGMQGLHSVQGGYTVQSGMAGGRPNFGGIPTAASQQQPQLSMGQGRFGGALSASGLQQHMGPYGQMASRVGLGPSHPRHLMNGLSSNLGSEEAARGSVVNPGLASARGPGMDRAGSAPSNPGVMGMAGAATSNGLLGMRPSTGSNTGLNLSSINNANRMGGLSINQLSGQLGNLTVQGPNHIRSNSSGIGIQGMASISNTGGPAHPSGDLLALMNKTNSRPTLSLGNMVSKGMGHDGSHSSQSGQFGGLLSSSNADQPVFDPSDTSDFPSLGATTDRGLGQDEASHLGLGGDSYSLSSLHKAGAQHAEFSIQNEDFPALSSASTNFPLASTENLSGTYQQGLSSIRHSGPQASSTGYDQQVLYNQQQQVALMQQQQSAGLQGAKGPGSGISSQDRFGIDGLLSVMKCKDSDIYTLAMGTDLRGLGLNLDSLENLYKTFGSPWADAPVRPEPDFQVPSCYLHSPPRLQPGYFAKFFDNTLFYIFYSMPGDEAQLFAADELANRGWWYHKELKAWITRNTKSEASLKSDRIFTIFDPTQWELSEIELHNVPYDALERAPNLMRPRMQAGIGAMQPQMAAPK